MLEWNLESRVSKYLSALERQEDGGVIEFSSILATMPLNAHGHLGTPSCTFSAKYPFRF